MPVHVDKARRKARRAGGASRHSRGVAVKLPTAADLPVLHGHVAGKARRARAVDNKRVFYKQIHGSEVNPPLL